MIFYWGVFLLLSLYVLLLLVYSVGWFLQKFFVKKINFVPELKISVIIAARNEALNIEKCLYAISAQNYPAHLFEIIVVDDFSEDNTAEIIQNNKAANLRLIRLADFVSGNEKIISFKKKALSTGIAASTGTLIVTTDADCWMGKNWLLNLADFYVKNNPEMIVSPVRFSCNNSLLQLFQSLDFMTMQGITAATVKLNLGIMCNGANLAFSRKAYEAVSGYDGIDHHVSGDDYLLQFKIKKQFPNGVQYLKSKEVIVDTLPQLSAQSFLQQRIRWASKTGKYDDHKMTFLLSLIYLFNCSILFLGFACFMNAGFVALFIWVLSIKTFSEILFLLPVAHFLQRKSQLFIFPFLQPFHILYIIVAGFLSRIGKFEWKKRQIVQ